MIIEVKILITKFKNMIQYCKYNNFSQLIYFISLKIQCHILNYNFVEDNGG